MCLAFFTCFPPAVWLGLLQGRGKCAPITLCGRLPKGDVASGATCKHGGRVSHVVSFIICINSMFNNNYCYCHCRYYILLLLNMCTATPAFASAAALMINLSNTTTGGM